LDVHFFLDRTRGWAGKVLCPFEFDLAARMAIHCSCKPSTLSCRSLTDEVRDESKGETFSRAQPVWHSHVPDDDPQGIEPTLWLRCARNRVGPLYTPAKGTSMRDAESDFMIFTCLAASFCSESYGLPLLSCRLIDATHGTQRDLRS